MATSSFDRFFDIPELIALLESHLAKGDLSRLARTNKKMQHNCTPSLFRRVEVIPGRLFQLFTSTSALRAFARNVHHVRIVHFGKEELAYYHNVHFASEEPTTTMATMLTTDTSAARLILVSATALNADTRPMIALPPMTHLSQLTLSLGLSRKPPSTMMSNIGDPRTTLAQVCWLILLNPALVTLNLHNLQIANLQDSRRLGWAIAGLSRIQDLDVRTTTVKEEWLELLVPVLFSVQPTIRQISVSGVQSKRSGYSIIPSQNDLGEDDEVEDAVTATTYRQEPLANLENLSVYGVCDWNSATNFRAILGRCPNIKKLDIPHIKRSQAKDDTMGEFVAKTCPKIESLTYRTPGTKPHDSLPIKIMDLLQAQRITGFEYYGTFASDSDSALANTAFRRHSTTLRTIRIHGTNTLTRVSASTILAECRNLEMLFIPSFETRGHYVTLDNVLELPWTCTKLRELTLSISGCELPIDLHGQPYYNRSAPVTLTGAETLHFTQLERLYQQIGILTNLKKLDLRTILLGPQMAPDNGEGAPPPRPSYLSRAFPLMLSLQNSATGLPGLLHHLAGLKKLEELIGSVCLQTRETSKTVGLPEAMWMGQNWPLLRHGSFFLRSENVTDPFKLLQDKRWEESRIELRLNVL